MLYEVPRQETNPGTLSLARCDPLLFVHVSMHWLTLRFASGVEVS